MSKIISEEVQKFIENNLGADFFKKNVPAQMSAYSILDVTISVNGMDEKLYEALPKEKKAELDAENKMAEDENDNDKLYNMLRKSLNPTTVGIIINKLLTQEEQIIPRLLQDLKRSGNDSFVEAGARLLIKAVNNYSKELAEVLPQIKYPYTKAAMCYVLGKIGSEEHVEKLYDSFVSFKNNYPNETYFEGPLLGLYKLKNIYEF